MVKVIVFEPNGETMLATVIDENEEVCRKNLTNFRTCPQRILDLVSNDIIEVCKVQLPCYLYRNADDRWEATNDAYPV